MLNTIGFKIFINCEMFDAVLKVLHEFQVGKGVDLEIYNQGIIEKRPGNKEVKQENRKGCFYGDLPYTATQEKLKSIYQELKKQQIAARFQVDLELGLLFKDYGAIDNVLDQGKTNLLHQNNEVLVLNIWATWCGPCQKPMQKNQQLLQKNQQNWKGKVRFVSISVDDQKQDVKERVTSKGWLKSTQLTLLGWKNDHPLINDYKLSGIPFFCIVNKWGKVVYIGHPSKIDVQKRVNQLLAQTLETLQYNKQPVPAVVAQIPQQKQSLSKQQVQEFIKKFNKQEIQKLFQNNDLIVLRYGHHIKLEKGIQIHNIQMNSFINDGDEEAEIKLNKYFQKQQKIKLNLDKVKYCHIPLIENPECLFCHQKNLQYPYYWLKWEGENNFGCRSCVEKKSTKPGHHYEYEKNSILLCGPWSTVAQKNVGNNVQPTTPQQVTGGHGYGCDGCGKGQKGIGCARYVSLGIRSHPSFKRGGLCDICESCIQNITQNNQEVIKRLEPQGFSPNHPYIRILYNVKGYGDY